MDREVAGWLAGLIEQAMGELQHNPGVTIEEVGNPVHWVQVLFEESEHDPLLTGFLVNFPYREHRDSPLLAMAAADITPPPDTRVIEWEDESHALLWLRPDVPLIPLGLFIGEIFEKLVGSPPDAEYQVRIEYGY